MRLAEIVKETPRQLLLHVQQLLAEEHPNFEATLYTLAPNEGRGGVQFNGTDRDERVFYLTVNVIDVKGAMVFIGENTRVPVAKGLSGQGLGQNSLSKKDAVTVEELVKDVYALMVSGFASQSEIDEHIPDGDIEAVFRNFIEAKKIDTLKDVISVTLEKDDDEGLQDLETRYNGTVYKTVNYKAAGQPRVVVLLVKGV